ncbi:MAG: P1 family peptidase [Candidatus Baltobacteraceae bacterium]
MNKRSVGRAAVLVALAVAFVGGRPAASFARVAGIEIGVLPSGALDAITDVAGVRVGQVTKISGSGRLRPGIGPVRTGATVILPNDDPWVKRVAAATYDLNGNGELTGAHWVDESGFLEEPIALTSTMNVARVDDGVEDWLIAHHPAIGVHEDVPLPVVAECDDQGLDDVQGRHVSPADVVRILDDAKPGAFPRGSVGAGTGMRAFGFKAGVGTASRVVAKEQGGYTVGVLVNANTGSREQLAIGGVPIGRIFAHELLPVFPKRTSWEPTRGRAADGSVIVVIATDAPLDHRQLHELAKRAVLGLGRTGATSHVSSGDLLIAFSTARTYPRDESATLGPTVLSDSDRVDALFDATAEATEAAVDDALFSARTMSGSNGVTFYGLPVDRVRAILDRSRPRALVR